MHIFLGGIAGGFAGFLMRPTVPLIGQLPLEIVLTRGRTLTGLDLILQSAAEASFNFMFAGVLIGGALGWILNQQLAKKEKS